LSEIDFGNVTEQSSALYHYNFGKALEATNTKDRALEHYRAAIEKQPDLDPATAGAFRILRKAN
jgi:hypothetical protein